MRAVGGTHQRRQAARVAGTAAHMSPRKPRRASRARTSRARTRLSHSPPSPPGPSTELRLKLRGSSMCAPPETAAPPSPPRPPPPLPPRPRNLSEGPTSFPAHKAARCRGQCARISRRRPGGGGGLRVLFLRGGVVKVDSPVARVELRPLPDRPPRLRASVRRRRLRGRRCCALARRLVSLLCLCRGLLRRRRSSSTRRLLLRQVQFVPCGLRGLLRGRRLLCRRCRCTSRPGCLPHGGARGLDGFPRQLLVEQLVLMMRVGARVHDNLTADVAEPTVVRTFGAKLAPGRELPLADRALLVQPQAASAVGRVPRPAGEELVLALLPRGACLILPSTVDPRIRTYHGGAQLRVLFAVFAWHRSSAAPKPFLACRDSFPAK